MPKLFFKSNRKNIQHYFASEQFIKPLYDGDLKIIESKNKSLQNTLKEVLITRIPFQKKPHVSWSIDLEKEGHVFSAHQSKKKCDTALLVMINNRLYVLMIEMKTSITNDGTSSSLEAIEQKFLDTMERISMLLTVNAHEHIKNDKGELIYENTHIIYEGIVLYNKDAVSVITDDLKKTEMYKIFKENSTMKRLYPKSLLMGSASRINIRFLKNPQANTNPDKMSVNFNQIFEKEIKFIGPAC